MKYRVKNTETGKFATAPLSYADAKFIGDRLALTGSKHKLIPVVDEIKKLPHIDPFGKPITNKSRGTK